MVRLVHADPQPGVRGDRHVEAPGRGRVADTDPEMVDASVGHGALAALVHSLYAVAVGIEQEAAVIVGGVDRARPGRAVIAVAGVDPRLPEGIDGFTGRCSEADVQPACDRVLTIRRPDVPILPLDECGVRVARLRAEGREDCAIKALGRGQIRDGDSDVIEHSPRLAPRD